MTTQRVYLDRLPARDGRQRQAARLGRTSAPQLFPTGAGCRHWRSSPTGRTGRRRRSLASVTIGADTYDATMVSPAPSSSLWQALFPSSTPVATLPVLRARRSSPLYSYPAGFVRHFFQGPTRRSRKPPP